jgi:hypothetical protein
MALEVNWKAELNHLFSDLKILAVRTDGLIGGTDSNFEFYQFLGLDLEVQYHKARHSLSIKLGSSLREKRIFSAIEIPDDVLQDKNKQYLMRVRKSMTKDIIRFLESEGFSAEEVI